MNLYKITQHENRGYDTYDSAIVCTETEESAKNFHPSGSKIIWPLPEDELRFGSWAYHREHVDVELIGTAVDGTPECVILASFNAG